MMDKLLNPTPSVLGKFSLCLHSHDCICCPPCGLIVHFFNHRLDYPGVGPEHSFLKDIGRAEYDSVTDQEALDGMCLTLFPSSVLVELIFDKFISNAPTK
jgi:hypothetical protein